MQSYKQLELPALIELLANQTEILMKMLYAGLDTEEIFTHCDETIRQIQAEIRLRKNKVEIMPVNGLNIPRISTKLL